MYSIATIDYIIIAIYLMGMIGVGVWFAKRHTDFDDFFLAGRSLTTPLLITTLFYSVIPSSDLQMVLWRGSAMLGQPMLFS